MTILQSPGVLGVKVCDKAMAEQNLSLTDSVTLT